jgi:hypothetical protein
VKRYVSLFLAACGASAPAPTRVVHVAPVAVAIVDAGPKCVEPIDEPLPKWVGTYPKVLPKLTNDAWAERSKMLAARNPDTDVLFVDQYGGSINGFTSKKTPYDSSDAYQRFVHGKSSIPLADVRSLLDDLHCKNPDVAHFEPTEAHLSRAQNLAFVISFEHKPTRTEEMIRNEPLPAALDVDTLAGKWSLGVEVARVHKLIVHHPGHTCAQTSGLPCDPIGPSDEEIEKRVPVGKVPIAKKYLQVNVTRASYFRATGIELRLVARVDVRWDELRAEVVTPRFGATLEPALTGNFRDVFDAVTGDPFNPYAP